jgi:predicted dehydrogenase
MPAPEDDDPRWSLELAGGALMDLGCYGLHIMRQLGHPSIVRAHADQRTPGTHGATSISHSLAARLG